MKDDADFDPNRIDTTETRAVVSKKIRKRRKGFTIVPGWWQERLIKARHIATYRTALHVLRRHWENGGVPFTLSNGAMVLEGVSRRQKWGALMELERTGLITIERRKRKSPRITVLRAE